MGFTFLYPNFLWALLLVLIPIIIHLFNFRRFKTVYFPNVELLKEIKEESKKSRTVKNWLVLLFRILFITFLVLAFAFPITGDNKKSEDEIVSIYLDNSFSMDAEGIEGNKLENAKAYADQLIQSLPPNSKIHLVTNNFEGNHQIEFNKKKAQEEISKIKPSPISQSFESILDRQNVFFQNKSINKPTVYWISDFQQLSSNEFENIDSFNIHLGLLESTESSNISVDSVWFNSPIRKRFGAEKMNFKLTNHDSENLKNFKVTLKINGRIASITIPNLNNGSSSGELDFQVPNDTLIKGEISIEDKNLLFDNKLLFSYQIPKQQNVLLISKEGNNINNTIRKIFSNDSAVNYSQFSPQNIDFGILAKQDFIILGELNNISQSLSAEVSKMASNGKSVAIIPGEEIKYEDYNQLSNFCNGIKYGKKDTIDREIGSVRKKHDFFSGVFDEKEMKENLKESFPTLFEHYELKANSNSEALILKEDDSPYLIKSGNIYLFSAGLSPSFSNIAQKALVVPLFYQMLFESLHTTPPQYFIEPNTKVKAPFMIEDKIYLKTKNQKVQTRINNQSFDLPENPTEGYYEMVTEKNNTKGAFALNYSRQESQSIKSQMDFLQKLEALPNISKFNISGNQLSNSEVIADSEGSLWFTCLIMSLIFLGLEMIFIRIKN